MVTPWCTVASPSSSLYFTVRLSLGNRAMHAHAAHASSLNSLDPPFLQAFHTLELMQDSWCQIVGYQLTLTVRYRECSNYLVFPIFMHFSLDNLELSLAWFGIKRSHGMAELPKWLTADAKLVYVPGHKRWKMSQAIGCWVWRWSEKV